MSGPTWEAESALWAEGLAVVAGCDEVGRGPLAGPVVAAAVILPRGLSLAGLDDSKKIEAARRESLHELILASAEAIGLGRAEAAEIDRLNILQASLLAMRRAVEALGRPLDGLLVDGTFTVPGVACRQVALVAGDGRSVSIAAASIVAKVTRDAELMQLDAVYPGYGFAGHKGYPSPAHLAALARLGPCPQHRRSFAPVRAAVERQRSLFEDGHVTP